MSTLRNTIIISKSINTFYRTKYTSPVKCLNPSFVYEMNNNINIQKKKDKLVNYQDKITYMYYVYNTIKDEDKYFKEMTEKLAFKN